MNYAIPLKNELLETEPWVAENLGFHILRASWSPRTMGTSDVLLESRDLRLHLVRDPLAVYANVAPLAEPDNWSWVGFVLEAIYGQRPECGGELHDVVVQLRDNLPALKKAMGAGWPDTKRELERLRQIRMQALMTPRPVNRAIAWTPIPWRKLFLVAGIAAVAAVLAWLVLVR